jgi:hypothetical protein
MKSRKLGIAISALSISALFSSAGVVYADQGGKTPPGQTGDFSDNGSPQSDLAHAKHKGRCSMSADGCAILSWEGVAGQIYVVQASVDMTTWTNIDTVTADSKGLCQFVDPSAPNFPHRFYRMVNP